MNMKTNKMVIGLSGHEYTLEEAGHPSNWNDLQLISTWRNPSRYELEFGTGAIHYLRLPEALFIKPDDSLKQWIKYEGKRYNQYR